MTAAANYAVKIVELLAESNEKMEAKVIAEKGDIPLRFCIKILKNLADNGLVKSYKGAKGGYMLADKADNITLRMVIESVEGPIVISKCLCEDFECSHAQCRFQSIYDEISREFRDKLDSYNFGDIMNRNGCADCTKHNE